MKKKIFALAVAAMAVLGARAQNMVNGHEYVDLGLPSGTLWATMNMGAASANDLGDKYAWGETTTKAEYTASNYTVSGVFAPLPLTNDAAYVNWGNMWSMPTTIQCQELIDKCQKVFDDNGVTFTGPNGNSIYFPIGAVGEYKHSYYRTKALGCFWLIISYKQGGITYSNSWYANSGAAQTYEGWYIRPVVRTTTISDIPEGWTVNGIVPTDGKVDVTVGTKVTVTPANLPVGKKIKSIKAVPTE